MEKIAQIRKLSLMIFLIPFLSINLCLLISTNYSLLEGSIFHVDFIGRSAFTIPYLDGGTSISRASRMFPQFLIFKPAMILTGVLLILYWNFYNNLISHFNNSNSRKFKFWIFGILSAICLMMHSLLLGVKFDIQLYKLFRRIVLLSFVIFELMAQGILIYYLFKIKNNLKNLINLKILYVKTFFVSLLVLVAIISIPILILKDQAQLKHALEWNFFVGVIIFYVFTFLFWKKTITT